MIKDRTKVVWLCHFVNQEMKDYFKTPNVNEMAPWINNLIELFKERNDIELHIVAPNVFTNETIEFPEEGVKYHFYQHRPSFIPKKAHSLLRFETLTNYSFVKKRIARIIKKITPDIIHLHGAENPYYSAGILPLLKHFPTLVTIQGFIRNTSEPNFIIKRKIEIEEEILKNTQHIGIRTKEMNKIASELNPEAHLHFHNYPLSAVNFIKDNTIKSTYDIIFFARVCKDKGIEDLIEALAVVKNKKPDVTLNVIGGSSKSYLQHLKNLMQQFDLEQNVKFLGFLKNQQDIYKHALGAKLCVLPTYHDIIPGTIIESMLLKLPIIAYAVGGIPELNDSGEAVVLVEKRNIKQLAEKILELLQNETSRNKLAEFAYLVVKNRFDNKKVVTDIINAYKEVLLSNKIPANNEEI